MADFGHANLFNLFSYNKFKDAWYSYLELLKIDFSNGFTCPECKAEPDLIICDGTSLSFQHRYILKRPKEGDDPPVKETGHGR